MNHLIWIKYTIRIKYVLQILHHPERILVFYLRHILKHLNPNAKLSLQTSFRLNHIIDNKRINNQMHATVQLGILPTLCNNPNVQIAISHLSKAAHNKLLFLLRFEQIDLTNKLSDILYNLIVMVVRKRDIILHCETSINTSCNYIVSHSPHILCLTLCFTKLMQNYFFWCVIKEVFKQFSVLILIRITFNLQNTTKVIRLPIKK